MEVEHIKSTVLDSLSHQRGNVTMPVAQLCSSVWNREQGQEGDAEHKGPLNTYAQSYSYLSQSF